MGGPLPAPGYVSPRELLGSLCSLQDATEGQCMVSLPRSSLQIGQLFMRTCAPGSPQGVCQRQVVCCRSRGRERVDAFSMVKQSSHLLSAGCKHRTHTLRHQSSVGFGRRVSQKGYGLNKGAELGGGQQGEEHSGCLRLGPYLPQTLPQGPQSLLSPSCPETEASVCRGPVPVQGAE